MMLSDWQHNREWAAGVGCTILHHALGQQMARERWRTMFCGERSWVSCDGPAYWLNSQVAKFCG